jgi:hypothetical protein
MPSLGSAAIDAVRELRGHELESASQVSELIQDFGGIAVALAEAIGSLCGQVELKDGMHYQTASDLRELRKIANSLYERSADAVDHFHKNHEFWLAGWGDD